MDCKLLAPLSKAMRNEESSKLPLTPGNRFELLSRKRRIMICFHLHNMDIWGEHSHHHVSADGELTAPSRQTNTLLSSKNAVQSALHSKSSRGNNEILMWHEFVLAHRENLRVDVGYRVLTHITMTCVYINMCSVNVEYTPCLHHIKFK